MKNFRIVIFLMILFQSCKGQSGKVVSQPETTSAINYHLDSLKWTYESEAYADIIILNSNLELYFQNLRNEKKKAGSLIKISDNTDKQQLQKILNDVPEDFIRSKEDNMKIGAPHEYDQGGYVLQLFLSDKSTRLIQVDADKQRWPAHLVSFLQEITDLYQGVKLRKG